MDAAARVVSRCGQAADSIRIGVRGSPRVRIPIRIVDEKVIAAALCVIIVSAECSVPHGEMACQACEYWHSHGEQTSRAADGARLPARAVDDMPRGQLHMRPLD